MTSGVTDNRLQCRPIEQVVDMPVPTTQEGIVKPTVEWLVEVPMPMEQDGIVEAERNVPQDMCRSGSLIRPSMVQFP